MLPSFVTNLPTRTEQGIILAVDLGGNHLRVCLFEFHGEKYIHYQDQYPITAKLKSGTFEELSDYIADAVIKLLEKHKPDYKDNKLCLGYTLSFPILHADLKNGSLHAWSRGFTCAEGIGKNPTEVLQHSFNKRHTNILVVTLTNDVVATFMASSFNNPKTIISMVIGCGFNMGFREKVAHIKHWPSEDARKTASKYEDMLINTEICQFSQKQHGIRLNRYERAINLISTHPHEFVCEKMIGGMYIGEIARHMFLDLASQGLLFSGGRSMKHLEEVWSFTSKHMSRIEADTSEELEVVEDILKKELEIETTLLCERQAVKKIVQAVGTKSAQYAACCLAAALSFIIERDNLSSSENYVVGIAGNLFAHYPYYEDRMRKTVAELLGDDIEKKIKIEKIQDGSGLGTALIAFNNK
ncbi:hypothetical protein BDF20DRAFT_906875 [Mycotypha africana]|uniref:uncharacterized protein n=1 Tax=Mycotypha africana TaxID=64632 RepID=UPI0022FFE22B|nr:uncharacterized protein BDF20DRAFT_906875 [Mycotypha africana]KAI8975703.1 hypothetical protein BDF20DRAFT_906875 [Mycotypha africana]